MPQMLDNTKTVLHLEARQLHDALFRVRAALSREETRYYLQGVYVHYRDGALRFAATDGHRLAVASVKTSDDYSSAFAGVILSAEFVAAAIKATSKRSFCRMDCPMIVTPQGVTLHPYGGEEIGGGPTSKIEGTFPDYTRVMPPSTPKVGTFTANREDLLNAVQAVTAFRRAATPGKGTRHEVIKFTFAADAVTVSAELKDSGRASIRVDAASSSVEGDREIGFNGRYVADALKSIESAEVSFDFNDAGGPNNWRGVGTCEEHATWTIMPVCL